MDEVQGVIDGFKGGTVDPFDAIAMLENVEDQRVSDLFVSVLSDTAQDDMVRIEILNALALRIESGVNRSRLAEVVLSIIEGDDDPLVKQHAARSAWRFLDYAPIVPALERIVGNSDEDEDLRYNALSSLQTGAYQSESCLNALRRIVILPNLGVAAQRTLDRIEKGDVPK